MDAVALSAAVLQVMDTLALNCSPHVRTQLAGKQFLQRPASLADSICLECHLLVLDAVDCKNACMCR